MEIIDEGGGLFSIKYSDEEKEEMKNRTFSDSLKKLSKLATKSDKMKQFLIKIANIRKNYKETFANQGQGMDGYSQLYNYNHIADEIIEFLDKENK